MASRAETRERTRERVLAAAREQIAEHGGVGLSMRAVARESGLVSSAVYRYFAAREDLLTAMIVESYGHLADELAGVSARRPAARWRALSVTFRAWARGHPHEFQLIYGTPVPGYVAPPETIPAAAAVAEPFLTVAAGRPHGTFAGPLLAEQFAALAEQTGGSASGLAAVLTELAALVGFVGLELAGHFVGTADPADALFAGLLDRQVTSLGLDL